MKKNIAIIIATLPVAFFAYVAIQLTVPLSLGKPVEVAIPEGTTYRQAITILDSRNLIRDRYLFLALGRLTGGDRKIRAGYYTFWDHITPLQVFDRLRKGRIIEYDITVVEGESLAEIGQRLTAKGILAPDQFHSLTTDREFLTSLQIDAPSLEGYLFPQTYRIPKGAAPGSVLKLMVRKMREEYSAAMVKRTRDMGWTEREILTLASIIEREAVMDKERPIISAVYHNRIKKGMPLQADPTAIYGVKSYKEKITLKDLKKKTEYNTYVIKGLPPGPIACPGKKSIVAALYPAEVPYLYFVSRGDGTHWFTNSFSEHEAAIREVRAMRAAAGAVPEEEAPEVKKELP
ncbi:MAG: endolytic transglycosylase MltG [Thermodesulfovibrionales bacterium]|jgi:UPF0755 protein